MSTRASSDSSEDESGSGDCRGRPRGMRNGREVASRGKAIRSDLDGHPDAENERLRGHALAPPARLARSHRGLDRPCPGRRPREMPGKRAATTTSPSPLPPTGLQNVLARYLGPGSRRPQAGPCAETATTEPAGLLQSGMLDPSKVAALMDVFRGELPARAERIEKAAQQHNRTLLFELAHQLKGPQESTALTASPKLPALFVIVAG